MSAEHAAAYEAARRRVAELAREGPEVAVPATPGWTVQDLVAHLTGLCTDWVTGKLGGYASAGWTANQVERRSNLTIDEILSEWERSAPLLLPILEHPEESGLPDPLMTGFGPAAAPAWPDLIVTDLAMHEQDVRGALDRPGARTSDALQLAMRSHVGLLRFVASANGLPPLLLRPTDLDRGYAVGRGEPRLTLTATLFELFRATGGRRSRAQLAALAWSTDPGPWLHHVVMPSYATPVDDLVE